MEYHQNPELRKLLEDYTRNPHKSPYKTFGENQIHPDEDLILLSHVIASLREREFQYQGKKSVGGGFTTAANHRFRKAMTPTTPDLELRVNLSRENKVSFVLDSIPPEERYHFDTYDVIPPEDALKQLDNHLIGISTIL